MICPPQVRLCRPLIHCHECAVSILVRANTAARTPVPRSRPLVPLIETEISLEAGRTFTPKSAIDFGNGIVRLPTSRDKLRWVSAIKVGLAINVWPRVALVVGALRP